jgi:hypothetical protein
LGASATLRAFNLSGGPLELVRRIFGVAPLPGDPATWVLAVTIGACTVVAAAIAVLRYQRLQVTR